MADRAHGLQTPGGRLAAPPWGDTEWIGRTAALADGSGAGLFERWLLLAPVLQDWAATTLG